MHAAVMSVNKRHGYAKSPFDQANLIVQAQSQIMHAYPSKVHRHRIFRLDCLANYNCVFVDRGDRAGAGKSCFDVRRAGWNRLVASTET